MTSIQPNFYLDCLISPEFKNNYGKHNCATLHDYIKNITFSFINRMQDAHQHIGEISESFDQHQLRKTNQACHIKAEQEKIADLVLSILMVSRIDHFQDQIQPLEKLCCRALKTLESNDYKLVINVDEERGILKQLIIWRQQTERLTSPRLPDIFPKGYDKISKLKKRAKLFANHTYTLPKFSSSSLNRTYIIYKRKCYRGVTFTSTTKPTGLLKGGDSTDPSSKISIITGLLEVVMFKIANHLGLAEHFVRTDYISLKTKDHTYEGSLQPYIDNISFKKLLETKNHHLIQNQDFIDCLSASVIFGMFDAHSSNILWSLKHSKPYFFDNSLSLPHSNECIKRGNTLHLGYRCHLLVIPQAWLPFKESSKQRMLSWLTTADEEVDSDRFYDLLYKLCPKNIFPNDWINTTQVCNAMICRVKKALNCIENANSPFEVILRTYPEFALLHALQMSTKLHNGELQRPSSEVLDDMKNHTEEITSFLSQVFNVGQGYLTINEILEDAEKAGVELPAIGQIHQEFTTAEDWIKRLVKYKSRLCKATLEGHKKEYSKLLKHYKVIAKVDHKDDEYRRPDVLNKVKGLNQWTTIVNNRPRSFSI